MAHVDPLIAQHPEFADTMPDLRRLTRPKWSALSRARRNAVPFLLGAGAGASVVLALSAFGTKKTASFAWFAPPRSSLLGNLARGALIALGRTMLRRALA